MGKITKKVKYIVAILLVVVTVCVVVLGVKYKNKDKGQGQDIDIPDINFPQYAGEYNDNIEFELNISDNAENNEILDKVYLLENSVDDKVMENIADIMQFSKKDLKKKDDTLLLYEKSEERLMIYKNGSFDYTTTKKKDINLEMTISDEECIKKAKEIMFSNDLLGEDCEYMDIGTTVIEEIGGEGTEKVIEKQVYFRRKIDDENVRGTRMAVVSIDAEGDVTQVSTNYIPVAKAIKPNKVISIQEAIKKVKKLEGMISMDESTDRVVIEAVEVVYWEDSSFTYDCSTIQPVYRIKGKAYDGEELLGDFEAFEQAVK